MGRFAIVDAERVVVNVVMWDPADEYEPGENLELVELADDAGVRAGDTIDKRGNVVVAAALDERPVTVDPYDALVAKLVDRKVLTVADAAQLAADTTPTESDPTP